VSDKVYDAAIEKYGTNPWMGTSQYLDLSTERLWYHGIEGFKAGAKWQSEQYKQTILDLQNRYQDAMIEIQHREAEIKEYKKLLLDEHTRISQEVEHGQP
jgi:hypothetical protein